MEGAGQVEPTQLPVNTSNISQPEDASEAEWSAHSLAYQISLASLLSAITLATSLSNAFVIATISQSKKLQTPANFLIASLAVTDLLVSILVMPVCVLYTVIHEWTLGQVVCDVWLSSDITCCTASILHLCVIALDRYWAITDAVEYSKKRTPGRAAGMVATAWVIAISISLPPLFSAYLVTGSPGSNASTSPLQGGRHDAPSSDTNSSTSDNQVKVTLSDAAIVCWLPFFIYTLVVATCDACVSPELFDFFTWLGYLNSLINPIIYTMSNEDFKKAFHKLVRFRCCRG